MNGSFLRARSFKHLQNATSSAPFKVKTNLSRLVTYIFIRCCRASARCFHAGTIILKAIFWVTCYSFPITFTPSGSLLLMKTDRTRLKKSGPRQRRYIYWIKNIAMKNVNYIIYMPYLQLSEVCWKKRRYFRHWKCFCFGIFFFHF